METQADNVGREVHPTPKKLSFNTVKPFTSAKPGRDLRAVSYLLSTVDKRDGLTKPEVNDDDQNKVYWKGYN